MVRSLWSAASGMIGQQANIDTISNNLANVNTTGYKKVRPEFEDLIYQTVRVAGTPATEDTVTPEPVQMGHGVKLSATQRVFDQGSLQISDGVMDMALTGEGFFRILLPDGTYGYTRDGSFKIDSGGQVVNSEGYRLQPEVVFPQDYIPSTVSVDQQGRVQCKTPGSGDNPVDVGQIELFRFPNPAGLSAVGENVFKETNASGEVIGGTPASPGFGKVAHKFLEMSNVSVVREMVNMIVAQRAYEFNSKAIQTSDNMLGTATSLKR
jgi:flagellar basal-body rod protein FlgG